MTNDASLMGREKPMKVSFRCLLCLTIACLLVNSTYAQERVPLGGSPDAKETPPPPGVDPLYWKLTKVKDRSIKATAERYVGLVRPQEWSDASGKFKTLARYVKHDASLASVTIEIIRGRGAEQTKEEKTVPVDKLSKQCQTRVRQIDATQKSLKEWAAAHPEEAGTGATAGASPDPGSPTNNEGAAAPAGTPAPTGAGPEGGATPPAAAPPANEPDPSASDPDPLGFAELPPAPAAPAAGPPAGESPPAN